MGTYQERVEAIPLSASTGFLRKADSVIVDAAEVAAEADARVAELEAELSGMVAAVELAAREEAAAKRDAAYWRKRGYDAERIAAEADARIAELEAALGRIVGFACRAPYSNADCGRCESCVARAALATPDAGAQGGAT